MQVCWNDWNDLDLATITDSDEPWWDHHMPFFSPVRHGETATTSGSDRKDVPRDHRAERHVIRTKIQPRHRQSHCVLSEISKLCRWSCASSATQPLSNCSNLSIAIQLWIGWRSLWTVKFACHLDKRMSRSSSTLSQVCITKLYCKLGEN